MKTFFDDESWAEYLIESTNSKFKLLATAKSSSPNFILILSGMSTLSNGVGSEIDLGFRHNPADYPVFNGTTCTISGVDGAFVTTSSQFVGPWLSHSLNYLGGHWYNATACSGAGSNGWEAMRQAYNGGLNNQWAISDTP